jgi:chromosome segregation ATPase
MTTMMSKETDMTDISPETEDRFDAMTVSVLRRRLHRTSDLLREANYKKRLAHQQIGKQGDTIYNLRAQVAELQGLISKEARGVYRRIQAQYDALYGEHQQTLEYVETLKQKLAEAEQKVPTNLS